ncbi:hypothetical protein ACQYAD_04230 [Neobacillus sp. SM06]
MKKRKKANKRSLKHRIRKPVLREEAWNGKFEDLVKFFLEFFQRTP